jgi:hypothetical protein
MFCMLVLVQANAPVLDALFADSVQTGRRAALYTLLHISYILSQVRSGTILTHHPFITGECYHPRVPVVEGDCAAVGVDPSTTCPLWYTPVG